MSEIQLKNIFKDCSQLQNTTGAFMNTKVSGSVSNLLFDCCRNTLTNTSYMFYKTLVDSIDVGKAKINYYESFTNVYELYLLEVFTNNCKYLLKEDTAVNLTFYNKYVNYMSDSLISAHGQAFIEKVYGLNIDTNGSKTHCVVEIFGIDKAYDTYLTNFYTKHIALKTNGEPEFQEFFSTFSEIGMEGFKDNYTDTKYSRLLLDLGFYIDKTAYYESEYLYLIYKENTGYSSRTTLKNRTFYNEYVATKLDTFKLNLLDNSDNTEAFFGTQIYTRNAYEAIVSNVEVVELGLFSDCTNLSTVQSMFENCSELKGAIPADMFYGTKELTNLKTLIDLFKHCHLLTIYGINGSTISPQKSVILEDAADDTWQEDIKPIDSLYTQLKGGNYKEVYPSISTSEGLQRVIGSAEKLIYLVPADWLKYCPNLTNVSGFMLGVGSPREKDENGNLQLNYKPSTASNETILNILKIPNTLFDSCAKIENASGAFSEISTIGLTELNSDFLSKSATSLTNILNIFKYSKLYSAGPTETNTAFKFPGISLNTYLKNASMAFFFTNALNFAESGYKYTDYSKDWYGDDSGMDKDTGDKYKHIIKDKGLYGYGTNFSNLLQFSNIGSNYVRAFTATSVLPFHKEDGSIADAYKSNVIVGTDSNISTNDIKSIPFGKITTRLADITEYTVNTLNLSFSAPNIEIKN